MYNDGDDQDDDQILSADEVLEEERLKKDSNLSVWLNQPTLPQDYSTPSTPPDDPLLRNLPADHPALDEEEASELYDDDPTGASDFWSQHESKDRKNDAIYGDNGPDL